MHEIVCLFAAPIPVGHRIECCWLSLEIQGIFSGARTHTHVHEPRIRDLETGIEYSSHEAYEHSGGKVTRQPLRVGPHPNPAMTISHRLVGVVRRCRVITCAGYERDPVQTHLDVEPVADPAG